MSINVMAGLEPAPVEANEPTGMSQCGRTAFSALEAQSREHGKIGEVLALLEVLTFRRSPARRFTPRVTCQLRR